MFLNNLCKILLKTFFCEIKKTKFAIKMKKKFRCIGIMSGTSLDGLDLALCEFYSEHSGWSFKILASRTVEYEPHWRQFLQNSMTLTGKELIELDINYGRWIALQIDNFLHSEGFNANQIDVIGSHGHTVFHAPEKSISLQIGHGAVISAMTNIDVVTSFRSMDVAMGGQGAPLVPVGDKLLFGQYDACLNLGGFANISFDLDGKRIGFDICPVNIILNYIAVKNGYNFDKDGKLATDGEIIQDLFYELENLNFYSLDPPKSLSKEWLEKNVLPLVERYLIDYPTNDIMETIYRHIVSQIKKITCKYHLSSVMVTGGGIKNNYLRTLLQSVDNVEFIVPERQLVDFKEALVFAFLALLNKLNQPNVWSSVTGSICDHIAGAYFKAPKRALE
ncbi:MAG: anhydro-N-acetylmuramic acid kinase [Vicingaceae bacterium]|nr:MAG: anhydro-N-acetylmuramic acid kinase [Vicingaceae bacterium]